MAAIGTRLPNDLGHRDSSGYWKKVEAFKDRKARQEEALRRFLNIGCKLTDFHQKSTSKRWTTPISPFLYQNIYPTTAPCGFAMHGRHARCFDMYHMHLQTMHKKAWIQSCENRNQAKTMELTFFRENLKKESTGNLKIDFKKRPKTAPMTKRDMIVFRSNPPGELGMFPQYTNFVKPMRLIPRRGKRGSRVSDIDFDHWDEMDELFSESELQFSEDMGSETELPIVIDPTRLYARFEILKTPPPPLERKKPPPVEIEPMEEVEPTVEPIPVEEPEPSSSTTFPIPESAHTLRTTKEVRGRPGVSRRPGVPAGKRGGRARKGQAVKPKEQKEIVKRTAPPPRETRRESYGYDEEESFEDSDDVRYVRFRENEGGRPGGRRQLRDEDEDDSYYLDDSFASLEDVSERGAGIWPDIEAERGSAAGRERSGRRRRPQDTRDRDMELEEPYEQLIQAEEEEVRRTGKARSPSPRRRRMDEEEIYEDIVDYDEERKPRRRSPKPPGSDEEDVSWSGKARPPSPRRRLIDEEGREEDVDYYDEEGKLRVRAEITPASDEEEVGRPVKPRPPGPRRRRMDEEEGEEDIVDYEERRKSRGRGSRSPRGRQKGKRGEDEAEYYDAMLEPVGRREKRTKKGRKIDGVTKADGKKSILKNGKPGEKDGEWRKAKKLVSIRFDEGLTKEQLQERRATHLSDTTRESDVDGKKPSQVPEFETIAEGEDETSLVRQATRTLKPLPIPQNVQEDMSETLRQMSRRQAERSIRKAGAVTVDAPVVEERVRRLSSFLSLSSSAKSISSLSDTDSIRISTLGKMTKYPRWRRKPKKSKVVNRLTRPNSNIENADAVAATAPVTPIWMKAKLGLSLKSSRFTVPIDFRQLQKMSPLDYVKKYCIVTSHRQDLCNKIFTKFKARGKPPLLKYEGLKGALEVLLMQNMDKGDLEEIFGILDINKDVTADETLFAAIAGFCERFICSNIVSDEPGVQKPRKNTLEKADLSSIMQKCRKGVVHSGIRLIMEVLMKEIE